MRSPAKLAPTLWNVTPTLEAFKVLERVARELGWGRLTQECHPVNDPESDFFGAVYYWWESSEQLGSRLHFSPCGHSDPLTTREVAAKAKGWRSFDACVMSERHHLHTGAVRFELPEKDVELTRLVGGLAELVGITNFRSAKARRELVAAYPLIYWSGGPPPAYRDKCVWRVHDGKLSTRRYKH